jgi:hypothetical protein
MAQGTTPRDTDQHRNFTNAMKEDQKEGQRYCYDFNIDPSSTYCL